MAKKKTSKKNDKSKECFIIMPISDPDGYEDGHFQRVYDHVFRPACENAGFAPVRADDVKETNLIHVDILKRLLNAPMAICDLSNHNPNVMFELGLRQAFDKPVVLVREVGTKNMFDISPIRFYEYEKRMRYDDVVRDQENIQEILIETSKTNDEESLNSLVKLLSLTMPAKLGEEKEYSGKELFNYLSSELNSLKQEMRRSNSSNLQRSTSDSLKNDPADFDSLPVSVRLYGLKHKLGQAKQMRETGSSVTAFSLLNIIITETDMIIPNKRIISQNRNKAVRLNRECYELINSWKEEDEQVEDNN